MKYLKCIFLFVLPLFAHMAGAQPNKDDYLKAVANHNLVSETFLDQKPLPIPAGLPDAKLPKGRIPDDIPTIHVLTSFDQKGIKLSIFDGKLDIAAEQGSFYSLNLDSKEMTRVRRLVKDRSEQLTHYFDIEFDMPKRIVGIRGLNLTEQFKLIFPGFDIRMGGIALDTKDFCVIESRTALTIVGKNFRTHHTAWHPGPNTVLSFSGDFEFGAIDEHKTQLTLTKDDGKTLQTPIVQFIPDGSYIAGCATGSLFGVQARNIHFKAGTVDDKVDLCLVPSSVLNVLADSPCTDQEDIAIQNITIEHANLNLNRLFWMAKEGMHIKVPDASYMRIAFTLASGKKSQYIFSTGPQPRLTFSAMFPFGPAINIDAKNAPHACGNQNINPLWVAGPADLVRQAVRVTSIASLASGNDVKTLDKYDPKWEYGPSDTVVPPKVRGQSFHFFCDKTHVKTAEALGVVFNSLGCFYDAGAPSYDQRFMMTTANELAQAMRKMRDGPNAEWTGLFSVNEFPSPISDLDFVPSERVTWPAIRYSLLMPDEYTSHQVI